MNKAMKVLDSLNPAKVAKIFVEAGQILFRYCGEYRLVIALALLSAMGGSVLLVLGPGFISQMVSTISLNASADSFSVEIDMARITQIGVVLICIYGASLVLNYLQLFIMSTVSCLVGKRMRKDISAKLNRIPLSYFDSHTQGDILSRVTNDVDTVTQSLDISVGIQISSATTLLSCTIVMLITEWRMALTAIITSLIGFVAMRVIIDASRKHFLGKQEILAEVNGHIEEYYSGQSIVRTYDGEEKAYKKFAESNERLRKDTFKAECLTGLLKPLMNFIGNFAYVAICIVGAALAFGEEIDFGVVVAFMIYVRLFTSPLEQLGQSFSSIQSALAASKRVGEFLEEEELPEESSKTASLKEVKGEVVFDHVNFGYYEDKPIVRDFSLHVSPGQKVAIVGPAGAGKTTIVNLLMRFYEVNKGSISVDGVPLADMKRENVHALFGMVLQDTWLFRGTIRENLVYAKEGVGEEELLEIIARCGLKHFIDTLPDGLDTMLDENVSISAGQKQLLTIARAMVDNAPMLILDEATSSVDTRTEEKIQEAMDSLMKGRTSFVIAHRLSTIKNADIIIYFQDGDVKETGTHDELMKKQGLYAELYNSQFVLNS